MTGVWVHRDNDCAALAKEARGGGKWIAWPQSKEAKMLASTKKV